MFVKYAMYICFVVFWITVDQFCQYIKSNLGFNSSDIDVEKVIGETRVHFIIFQKQRYFLEQFSNVLYNEVICVKI